jgi:hypothetical protein
MLAEGYQPGYAEPDRAVPHRTGPRAAGAGQVAGGDAAHAHRQAEAGSGLGQRQQVPAHGQQQRFPGGP